uniref:Uncharacterized protein n=1 Tax=Helianthus annuus TaxID=4232 RepID=A0A251SDM3_HELAN
MSNYDSSLGDPSIKELVEQIAKDPSFNQMAEQLHHTFHGANEGIPQFDTQQFYSTMEQVMQNPQFMNMAERLGSAMMIHRCLKCLKVYPTQLKRISLKNVWHVSKKIHP